MKKIWMFLVMCLFLSACSIQLSTPGKDNLGGASGNDISGEESSGNDILGEESSGNDVSEEDSPWKDTLEELKMRDGDPSFLDNTRWSCTIARSYSHSIKFGEMGEFAQHIYTWDDSKRMGVRGLYCADEMAYYILDEEDKLIDIGKILYADDHYLVMDFWNLCRAFRRKHDDYTFEYPHNIVPQPAQMYVGIYYYTKPRLRIAGYEDGKISVFQCTYDTEEAAKAKVWELNLSEDCEFKSVVYSVASDTAEVTILEKSAYESASSEYGDGFFDFNSDGEVSSVIFYSEVD